MADTFKGIITADGKKRQLPYENVLKTPISDETLSIQGGFADAKVVGDKFKAVKEETNSLKEDLSNKITKFYASSQGEPHLADSGNGKIQDMMIYGKSEQKQYSGKNLFTFSNDSRDVNGVIFEAKDGIITAKGTSTKDYTSTYFQFNYPKDIFTIGETYTFSLNSNDANLYLYALYKENDMTDYRTLFGMTTKCATVKIPDNVDLAIRCVVRINTTVNATATIQIEKGSTATSYEPYVGGQPSPSPDYPQEIKSVVNPTVKVCGKNLYPGSDLIGLTKTYTTDFIPVILHKGKIYFSFDTSSDTSDGRYHINAKYFDINKELMGGNGKESISGNNISHVSFEFDGTKAGINYETIDLKNVSYVKIMFGIYATTATEITYKNIMISATDSDFEPYKPIQTVTLPYTLNAIPVESGGNVTIDGQQYIADYVDVERGKLAKMVDSSKLDNTQFVANKTEWLLAESQEIDLTTEEITAFKALTTYYPTTNISVNSEQLDGYTIFNYPISMENGWNYVKQQIGDTREYIYDIDARTQDTDLQAAEAYVNSEYAVALTELEV